MLVRSLSVRNFTHRTRRAAGAVRPGRLPRRPAGVSEFYLRMSDEERFGILKMAAPHKGNRVVEKITIVPVTKEMIEEPDIVPTYHSQAGEGMYKIWPQKPLEPGEYAVVEYTEGKVNMQVWDFSIGSGSPAPSKTEKH